MWLPSLRRWHEYERAFHPCGLTIAATTCLPPDASVSGTGSTHTNDHSSLDGGRDCTRSVMRIGWKSNRERGLPNLARWWSEHSSL